MTNKLTTIDGIETELRELVCLDRKRFLSSISAPQLVQGTLLDLHHQTILRLVHERSEMPVNRSCDFVAEYASNSVFREELLQQNLRTLSAELNKAIQIRKEHSDVDIKVESPIQNDCRGGFTYRVGGEAEVKRRWENLSERANSLNPAGLSFFAPGAFAYFRSYELSSFGNHIRRLSSTYYASVGALMYYGFNAKRGRESYLLEPSIAMLTSTFLAHAHDQVFLLDGYDKNQGKLISRARDYCDQYGDSYADIYAYFSEAFAFHELGHRRSCDGYRALEAVLTEAGASTESLYDAEFPSDIDLRTWDRVRHGCGGVRDVLFLYGDFLANFAAIEIGLSEMAIALIEWFNWWLLRPASYGNRPRGVAAFIVYALERDKKFLFVHLGKLLRIAKNEPGQIVNACQEFEVAYFNRLKQIFDR